jgi:hypothetical protein
LHTIVSPKCWVTALKDDASGGNVWGMQVLTMVAAGEGSHVANKASVAYRACLCTMS